MNRIDVMLRFCINDKHKANDVLNVLQLCFGPSVCMYDVSEKLYDAVKKKYYGKKKPAAYCYRCGADHSPVLDSCPICGQDDEDDDGWGSLPSSLDWVAHESRCCVFVFTNGVIGDLLALASNGVPYFDRSKLLV